ncbi:MULTISPECIES: AAA domain-containing protein [unclassified Sulfitobacter]|uniref:AAA domain-containing protein n=1 Tax=unclassified Sulfitobacter TaxID=196795 RepID=UPI0023E0EC1D|nr:MULTISPECIES: AAA domain-containing protein [unclassified Sulfitobacter]MDF3384512.1 hypothetical protein [Sulfitobacter sp. Ks11]MDF3387930.1 hypothetical protein [Sulfitobacter sp. M85]MDF3391350.1 hypothetical protein [Sulfitobacter sp. Ks16]MDF3401988.1 hypothetical protein [Sulfitobacter sp. KE39]MDF3405409.1 hypothetical protein [Sulfitobacter sp. Ks35]
MSVSSHESVSPEERNRISHLLGFAGELLVARSDVQMEMKAGLGVFHENQLADLPGLDLNCEDGAWLRIARQQESRPAQPPEHVAEFLKQPPVDPYKAPDLKPAISIEVTIEEASDLIEMGLLDSEDVHIIVEDGVEVESRVKVTLHAENCPEMRRDFEAYAGGPWADWSHKEKPVRRAMTAYNDLFKIHSAIHTSEGAPPELIWGIGIGRWKKGGKTVDMPIMEQSLDIEVENEGAIAIRPRDLSPTLSLKPYIQLDIDGTPKLQRELQENLEQFLRGDVEFSPFTTLWEPLLDTAASNISSDGVHITRDELDEGEKIEPVTDHLRITSGWAIFGRPRSNEFRVQDIQKLRKQVEDEKADVPAPIRGFTATPKEEAPKDISAFGLDSSVLSGVAENKWEPSAGGDVGASLRDPAGASGSSHSGRKEASSKVHFFPLPFNEEQGRISDMIDDPSLDVVCVSGPPGTGKSHSIANIISHEMAMGKRVLVTARTPEAIAAVREKLPKSLQSLVIASVGTDRESAQQLQEAVSELSSEVVGLDVDEAQAQRRTLEQKIIDCDAEIRGADHELADIARVNLAEMEWNSSKHSPMEIVEILAADEPVHGWFTDRPSKQPPSQLDDILGRLKGTLPELAPDIVYAGAKLPKADDLPSTANIVAAHKAELAWHKREKVDPASAPTMARDGAATEEQARAILRELNDLHVTLCDAPAPIKKLAIQCLQNDTAIGRKDIEATDCYLSGFERLIEAKTVRYDLGDCRLDDFKNAASRGLAGQKPVGFSIFNKSLKEAVASVKIDGNAPMRLSDWQHVLDTYRLQEDARRIEDTLRPLIDAGLFPAMPNKPWDIAGYLLDRHSDLEQALSLATRVKPVVDGLGPLFPVDLDLDALCTTLDCQPAIYALRANLPDKYEMHPALAALSSAAGEGTLPILGALSDLASAIGNEATKGSDLVKARAEITKEMSRLGEVSEKLERLGTDLAVLCECEAPDWADRLKQAPERASELIPDGWQEAWKWAVMKGRVDRIVDLGNGDEHRKRKADATKRRAKALEDLIRVRTLIGLKSRMTKPVRQAMEAFTQAVSKIGTGKGKKAPRFIRAAQDAAKQASSAAPVWIMPEYKIPEQLPAKFGDFDLVVLDEASQSDITALAALARGKKILVVGDEEQVSPSVVGIAVQKVNALRAEYLDGLPSADLIDENSSIFEITKRMHPESHVMLREHFRCVAPIINFSTQFYNNALVPLRVPKASERFDPPLADVYIPGATRDGSINDSEAKWIVDEIARIIREPVHEGRDIGVISLIGGAQADKIGRMLMEDPRVGTDKINERRIIFGDARTMQGQERSIVFLSMVATPGHAHAQTSKADQQRFNVAMSRAKDRLYLVRSVTLEDLKSTDIKSKVLQHFADPMPDGRTHTKGESLDLMELCESGFEKEVLKRLMDANYRVRPQVSAGKFRIDLVVEGAEDRRLAIELDGDAYHGPEVWDRDMLRQSALERAGWVFWRVFGSQWATNKEYWWNNLCETLSRLGIEPIGAAAIDERFTETITVYPEDDWDPEASQPASDEEDSLDDAISDSEIKSSDDAEPEIQEQTGALDQESDDATASNEADEGASRNNVAEADASKSPQATRVSDRQATLPLEGDLFSPRDTEDEPSPTNGTKVSPEKMNGFAKSAQIGTKIRLQKLEKGGGKMEVTLVSERDHDAAKAMIGVHTPLGEALLDKEIGEVAEFTAGAYVKEVRIIDFF